KGTPETWTCDVSLAPNPKPETAQLFVKSVYPLRPAHFRKIVYPSCVEKNRAFDLCTKEDYTPTTPGQLCEKDRHAICQGEKYLD
ncbi:MAG: hypothetical protein AAB250_16080, partial [Bdellovibrionota bacterium]